MSRFPVLKIKSRRKEKEVKEPEFGEKPAYLLTYMESFAKQHGEEPMFVERPTGDMKMWSRINVIYPVGGGVFIHVTNLVKTATGYNQYVSIEPPRPPSNVLKAIEEALALKIKPEHALESAEERKRILLELLEDVLDVKDKPVNYASVKPGFPRVPVYKKDADYVKYHLIRDKIGVGIIEPFLRDPYLEDISAKGIGNIYVVHKIFGSLETNIGFQSEDELDEFIIKLGEKIGKPISRARPVVDATLPDGSRINIVYGTDVSLFGSNFTIRKVAKTPISVTQLIKWNTFNEYAAAYMWMMLAEGMSAFICGETASGKTTALNALAVFIRPNYKIVSIEDTAEVVLPHKNWVRELTRDTGKQESSVTMFDLLRAALRQRPNYIIVGEIRGAEGNIAFQAMQTGHPVLSTFHAANLERLLQRLTNPPISVPKTNLDTLNIAWFQSSVYDKRGMLVRRMITINEIIGYDPRSDSIAAIPVFNWDPTTDVHRFAGRGSSYLLEEKIAVMRGISRRDIKLVYEELELRARYLRLLVEKNVLDYNDVYKAVVKTYELGLEEAYKRLFKGELF
uniref:Flagellar protein FlaI n=1 Tax=Thermosphaera aggregans TaxID=54254 RepID=A0A7C2BM91_9CREN